MDYSIIRKIFLDCFKFDRIDYEPTKVLTLAHDNDRSLLHNGKYYSPLVDTIEDDLAKRGVKCVSVARIISRVKGPLSYGNARSPEGHFARALVLKRLKALFVKGRYPYSTFEEKTWGRILDVTGAKKVVGILPSRELCVACRKRGIWVADVQHGVIAERHPWYGENFRSRDQLEYLPHTFLCWDLGSRNVIRKWSEAKGITPKVIGNRWLNRFARVSSTDNMVKNLSEAFENEFKPEPGRKTILVALSWGDYNIPNGFIAEGLEAVIRKTSKVYRWLIRLHPNQLKGFATDESVRFFEYFNRKLEGHAEWKVPTAYPLPVVLKNIDLHISWMSSVCIEAAQLGVKSALLNPRLRSRDEIGDYYEYYRGTGMVELVPETESEVNEWILNNIAVKHQPENYDAFNREYEELIQFLAN